MELWGIFPLSRFLKDFCVTGHIRLLKILLIKPIMLTTDLLIVSKSFVSSSCFSEQIQEVVWVSTQLMFVYIM